MFGCFLSFNFHYKIIRENNDEGSSSSRGRSALLAERPLEKRHTLFTKEDFESWNHLVDPEDMPTEEEVSFVKRVREDKEYGEYIARSPFNPPGVLQCYRKVVPAVDKTWYNLDQHLLDEKLELYKMEYVPPKQTVLKRRGENTSQEDTASEHTEQNDSPESTTPPIVRERSPSSEAFRRKRADIQKRYRIRVKERFEKAQNDLKEAREKYGETLEAQKQLQEKVQAQDEEIAKLKNERSGLMEVLGETLHSMSSKSSKDEIIQLLSPKGNPGENFDWIDDFKEYTTGKGWDFFYKPKKKSRKRICRADREVIEAGAD